MLDGESKKVKEPDIPSVDTDPADEENIPLVWPRFVESLYIVQKPLAPEPVPVSKLAVIKILEDVADGVISTDKVFDAVTKDVDADDVGVFLLQGVIRADTNFPTYAIGETLYVPEAEVGGKNVPEGIVPDSTGDFVQVIGWAADANTVYFSPNFTMVEVA